MRLTVKGIERLKRPGSHGLYLKISPSGIKSWVFRFERGGRERWMGLGPLHVVSLKSARERARRAREQLLDGVDPIEARKAEKAANAKAMTFSECVKLYYEQHQASWRSPKTRVQFRSSLENYAILLIGSRPVSAIDTAEVLRVLEQPIVVAPAGPLWTARPETASRLRGRIEVVLDWAQVRGQRSGENPARWRGHLDQCLPARVAKVEHFPALPYRELPAFMIALSLRAGIAAKALQFLILTAARTGEVIGAKWSEIDLDARIWMIPPERMKANKEHRVPLSDAAIEILQSLPTEANNNRVFLDLGPGAMMNVLRAMGHEHVTAHGFRSSFMDWCHERSSFPKTVIDMALAHTVGDKVEAAYRRTDLLDQRAQLMQSWARYCLTAPSDAKVLPMRGAS
jgi:integrase